MSFLSITYRPLNIYIGTLSNVHTQGERKTKYIIVVDLEKHTSIQSVSCVE